MITEPGSLTRILSGWRVWLPAFGLVSVAFLQITLALNADLSPWKGGGFGMFATTDGTAFRHIRIFVEAPGRSEELEIARSQEIPAARARLFPSESMLLALAKSVAERERRYGRPVKIVKLEVWRADVDEHLEVADRQLRTFTWHVEQLLDNTR